jgi:hypothetical protein
MTWPNAQSQVKNIRILAGKRDVSGETLYVVKEAIFIEHA